MFGWLFGKKKTEVKQEVKINGTKNRVIQSTTVVNQKGARASGDIVGGNKYSTYTQDTSILNDAMLAASVIQSFSYSTPSRDEDTCTPAHSHHSSSSYESPSSSYDSCSSSDSSSSYSSDSSSSSYSSD